VALVSRGIVPSFARSGCLCSVAVNLEIIWLLLVETAMSALPWLIA
jgi:hypothetical protein